MMTGKETGQAAPRPSNEIGFTVIRFLGNTEPISTAKRIGNHVRGTRISVVKHFGLSTFAIFAGRVAKEDIDRVAGGRVYDLHAVVQATDARRAWEVFREHFLTAS